MMSMEEILSRSELRPQLNTIVIAGFAALSLLIAAVGLYSVVSQSVSQRRQEIGIRVALGATPREVISVILKEGITLAVFGMAIGLAVGIALTRLMQSLLFGLTTNDPWVLVIVPLLVFLVAGLASLLPALRAASSDPLEALRSE